MQAHGQHGIVFAYDEAKTEQITQKEQFPLSLLLDVFQSCAAEGHAFHAGF